MPCPLSDKCPTIKPYTCKYPIPISQICLVNTDVLAGVDAPPLDTQQKTHCKMRACTDHPFIVTSSLLSTPSVLPISEVYAYLHYTKCTLSTTQVTFTINYTSMFVLSGPKSSVYLQSHYKHYKFIIHSLAQLNERTPR